jgi:hypothetical protein
MLKMTVLTGNETWIKGNYSIEIEERFAACDNGRPSYKVITKNITTGQIIEEMSDTVYLSMNAVKEFIDSIKVKKATSMNKTIKFDDLMKVFKKYVAKSETRPVLQLVQYANGYFTATDSHQLLRVNADYVSDIPESMVEGSLFNPKEMTMSDNHKNYPETSRLIPQYSDSTIILNKDNIKSFEQELKAIKKLSTQRNKVVKMEFGQLESIISGKELTKEGLEITHEGIMKNVTIEGNELTISASNKYLLAALDSVKKLSKLSNNHIEMGMNGRVRPIVIKQDGVFDVIVLPVRTY